MNNAEFEAEIQQVSERASGCEDRVRCRVNCEINGTYRYRSKEATISVERIEKYFNKNANLGNLEICTSEPFVKTEKTAEGYIYSKKIKATGSFEFITTPSSVDKDVDRLAKLFPCGKLKVESIKKDYTCKAVEDREVEKELIYKKNEPEEFDLLSAISEQDIPDITPKAQVIKEETKSDFAYRMKEADAMSNGIKLKKDDDMDLGM